MPAPFNYMLNVPDPTQSVMSGVQNAVGISNALAQRDAADLKTQQTKLAMEQQAALQADLGKIAADPSPSALAGIMVKYPQLSEQFKRTYDVLNTEQQQSRTGQAMQVYAALQAEQPDVALKLLTEQAAAARNSGDEKGAKAAETIFELVKLHPKTAMASAGMFLANAMGSEKFTETFTKLGTERRAAEKGPSELTEAQAKAQKAAVDAKFAESEAALGLQKKGWDIIKIQEDIKVAKENSRIAAMNAATSREGNALKKQEMEVKLEEMKVKRDEMVRAKAADIESGRLNMDNMLNTADRILKTPIDVVGAAAGPVSSRLMTTSQDTADFEALVETLGSQSFLAQIPNIKGMGALSNAEGEKLQAALQNFTLKQSPERLLENVKEAQRLILKARKNLATRYGVPETIPDTPAAAPDANEIDALVKKHGGGQ